jgi:hypothetical protein
VFSKELKEIAFTDLKQVSSLNTPTPKKIRIVHRFFHNNGRSIVSSMVLLEQSFQGKKEKLSIICSSNLDYRKVANIIYH